MKIFTDKHILRESVTSRPALQEILKLLLQTNIHMEKNEVGPFPDTIRNNKLKISQKLQCKS